MAPDSNDMSDLDRPVTHRELRTELQGFRQELLAELRAEFATKAELQLVRADLQAGTEQLRAETSAGFAEMRAYVDSSLKSVRDELRVHFDLTAERFRSEFRNLYDWTLATTTSLATRVEALEQRDAPPGIGTRHA
jgi:hypothetical protein